MSYTVKLFDKTSVVITDAQAEVVKSAKMRGIRSIEINGNVYDSSAIATIVSGGRSHVNDSRSIDSGYTDNRGTINSDRWDEARKRLQKTVEKSYLQKLK